MTPTTTTMTGQQFNRDVSRARRAAASGPVFITDRGRPAHVLLAIEEYQRLIEPAANIVDLLAMPGGEDIEFELPPRGRHASMRVPDFGEPADEGMPQRGFDAP